MVVVIVFPRYSVVILYVPQPIADMLTRRSNSSVVIVVLFDTGYSRVIS